QERLRTRVRDGAEVLDEFITSHPDARVRDRQGPRLVVRGQPNLKRQLRLEHRLTRGLKKAQFLQRIRGVRDQLAQEDFAIRVERMDDDIEDPLNLGLEGMMLFLTHGPWK